MATPDEIKRYMALYYMLFYGIYWFDWASGLSKEYRKIWKAQWSIVKVCYLANRYSMLVQTGLILAGYKVRFTTAQCNRYLLGWQVALPIVTYTAAGGILIMRTYAIWGRNKRVAYGLTFLHALHMSIASWTAATVDVVQFDHPDICLPKNTSRALPLWACITALMFDLSASVLGLAKALQLRKGLGPGMRSEILVNIIRHGTFYAIGSTISVFAQLGMVYVSRDTYHTPLRTYTGSNICLIFTSILTARLALSLKKDAPPPISIVGSGSGSTGFWSRSKSSGKSALLSPRSIASLQLRSPRADPEKMGEFPFTPTHVTTPVLAYSGSDSRHAATDSGDLGSSTAVSKAGMD